MAWNDLLRELQEFDFTPEGDDDGEDLRLFDPDLDGEDWDEEDEEDEEEDDWDEDEDDDWN
jgi:hypothetical protein